MRGAPITIPEEVITTQQRNLEQYFTAGAGFPSFFFAIGSTAVTDDSKKDSVVHEEMSSGQDNSELVTAGVRKLFKLGQATNLPRGAPGRLSTAYGSLSSAKDQFIAALRVEEKAKESLLQRNARRLANKKCIERERPLVDFLKTYGYMRDGDKLVKKTLAFVLEKNPNLIQRLGISISFSRATIIEALLQQLKSNSLKIINLQ